MSLKSWKEAFGGILPSKFFSRRAYLTVCPSPSSGLSTTPTILSVRYLTAPLQLPLRTFGEKHGSALPMFFFLVINESWKLRTAWVVWTISGIPVIQLTGDMPTNIVVWSGASYPVFTSTKTSKFLEIFFKSRTFRSSVGKTWASLFPTLLSMIFTGRKVKGWGPSRLQPKRCHQLQGYRPIRGLVQSIFRKQTVTNCRHRCQCYLLIGYRWLNTPMILLEGVWDRCKWKVMERGFWCICLRWVITNRRKFSRCVVLPPHRRMIIGGRWLEFALACFNTNTCITMLSLLFASAAGCLTRRLDWARTVPVYMFQQICRWHEKIIRT